jgi:hypothetical protein
MNKENFSLREVWRYFLKKYEEQRLAITHRLCPNSSPAIMFGGT